MRLPINALAEYLTPLPAADEIARQLTAIGFEVEGREDSADGVVLEINVTPNRGDAFSVRGLARELGAAQVGSFREIVSPELPANKAESSLPIHLMDPRCQRYLGVEIRKVKNGDSPADVQKRLADFGLNPISVVVDAANWVMMELGQPLHTFDLETLQSAITVRAARPGEKLATLDGQGRDLTPWPLKGQSFAPLLICDGEAGARPIALAGVMGGRDTEVNVITTENIYLEAATFEPLAIRRTARQFELPSEASRRFERGVDPALPAMAAARFVQLLRDWGAAGEVTGWQLVETARAETRSIELRDAAIQRLLGIAVPRSFIEKRLIALGLVCRDCGNDACRWEIPSWRSDLVIEEDLIEEIGRHYGYDKLPEILPSGNDPAPGRTELQKRLEILRQRAFALGFSETVTIPFTAETGRSGLTQYGEFVTARLQNPIWMNQPDLRENLVSTLAPVLAHNLQPDVLEGRSAEIRLFEIGTTFAATGNMENATRERTAMALAITRPGKIGLRERHHFMTDLAHQLFGAGYWDVYARDLEERGGFRAYSVNEPDSYPVIIRYSQDPNLGVFTGFIIVPDVKRLEFPTVTVRPLPRFPAIIRDLNLLVPSPKPIALLDESMRPVNRISAAVMTAGAEFLENHHNLDRGFFGKGLPDDYFALAMRFTFRKPDGTLTAEEAEAGLETIKAALAKIGVTVRT